MTSPVAPAMRHARTAIEAGLVLLLVGLLLWDVRSVLTPLVVFPLVLFALWPARTHPLGLHALVAVSLIFAIWFVAAMASVLTPFALAFAIAYLLAPAVSALERRRAPRPLAIALVLVPFLGVIALLILLLVPALERQVLEFAGRVPELARRLLNWGLELRTRFLASGGAGLLTDEQLRRLENLQPSDIVALFSDKWQAIGTQLWRALLGIGRGIGSGLGLLLLVVGYLIVAPIVTFHLLLAWPRLTSELEALVPPARRAEVFGFLREYDVALGRFVRGQLTEATLVAVLTGTGLGLLGFPGAVLVAVVAGIFNLIPVIGFPISALFGVVFALVAPDVGDALLKLAGVFVAVQILDGQVTGPRIVGGSVGLNPVWVMIAVLIFGSLLGFVGMLLAVPLAVLVKMLVVRAFERYRRSSVYAAEAGGPSA